MHVRYLLIACRYDSRFTIHHLLNLIANCYYIPTPPQKYQRSDTAKPYRLHAAGTVAAAAQGAYQAPWDPTREVLPSHVAAYSRNKPQAAVFQ